MCKGRQDRSLYISAPHAFPVDVHSTCLPNVFITVSPPFVPILVALLIVAPLTVVLCSIVELCVLLEAPLTVVLCSIVELCVLLEAPLSVVLCSFGEVCALVANSVVDADEPFVLAVP